MIWIYYPNPKWSKNALDQGDYIATEYQKRANELILRIHGKLYNGSNNKYQLDISVVINSTMAQLIDLEAHNYSSYKDIDSFHYFIGGLGLYYSFWYDYYEQHQNLREFISQLPKYFTFKYMDDITYFDIHSELLVEYKKWRSHFNELLFALITSNPAQEDRRETSNAVGCPGNQSTPIENRVVIPQETRIESTVLPSIQNDNLESTIHKILDERIPPIVEELKQYLSVKCALTSEGRETLYNSTKLFINSYINRIFSYDVERTISLEERVRKLESLLICDNTFNTLNNK